MCEGYNNLSFWRNYSEECRLKYFWVVMSCGFTYLLNLDNVGRLKSCLEMCHPCNWWKFKALILLIFAIYICPISGPSFTNRFWKYLWDNDTKSKSYTSGVVYFSFQNLDISSHSIRSQKLLTWIWKRTPQFGFGISITFYLPQLWTIET